MPLDEYRTQNLANWNDRVPIHVGPGGYDLASLIDDPDAISPMVEFDRTYLPDVAGASLLHLQCHIGSDTLSWARLGARVTGLDFSAPALAEAAKLADAMGLEAAWIEAELYDAPSAIGRTFDIVYTSVGTITWLPDIRGWAQVAASFVRPGGRFYIRDGHPMLYTLDDERDDDQLVVTYPYFETAHPTTFDEESSYVGDGVIANTRTNEWNHGLGEIVTALIDAGLRIDLLHEHRGLDWPFFTSMPQVDGRWVMPDHQRDLVPLEYSILATKPE